MWFCSCRAADNSDYVEFSNFNMLPDRKLPRFCNMNVENMRPIVSDGSPFRVTFKSNEFYDDVGFEALYQFEKHGQQGQMLKLRDLSLAGQC
jgi:hypothetical protein